MNPESVALLFSVQSSNGFNCQIELALALLQSVATKRNGQIVQWLRSSNGFNRQIVNSPIVKYSAFLPFYFFTLLPLTNAGGHAQRGGDSGQNRNNHLNDEFNRILFHGISF